MNIQTKIRFAAMVLFSVFYFACGQPEQSDTDHTNQGPDSLTDTIDENIVLKHSCEGVSCWLPPVNQCTLDNQIITYSASGYCQGGECQYSTKEQTCDSGEKCIDGFCVANPCQGVICSTPPVSVCATDDSLNIYSGNGYCHAGECFYTEKETLCDGGACTNGVCVKNTCQGVFCNKPPARYCLDNTTLRTFSPKGVCTSATGTSECRYSHKDLFCKEGCKEGTCVKDPCAGIVCNTPKARYCDGGSLVVWDTHGRCDDGKCTYQSQGVDCKTGCKDGLCVGESACIGLTCNEPPANYCSSKTILRTFRVNGGCEDGFCHYPEEEIYCAGGCEDGVCKDDPCAGVSCETPPPATCVLDQLRIWDGQSGVCSSGICNYQTPLVSCDNGCIEGQCLGNPCNGVVCSDPQADYCKDSKTLVTFQGGTGICESDGVCSYSGHEITCLDGCEDGMCLELEKPVECEGELAFQDKQLEAAVRGAVGIPEGPLYFEEVSRLKVLDAEGQNTIKHLGGIQCLRGLEELDLAGNRIANISLIDKLTNLQKLDLNYNQIVNIAALASLSKLKELNISNNKIKDISPLGALDSLVILNSNDNEISSTNSHGGLTQLKTLNLSQNAIIDITVLKSLDQLEVVNLSYNQIPDVSALTDLTALNTIDLSYNQVKDIEPLSLNKGLAEGDLVNLNYNRFRCDSEHLAVLESRVANVSSAECLPEPPAGCEGELSFPDPALNTIIRNHIAKPDGPIEYEDAAWLTMIGADHQEENGWVKDISGVECLPKLQTLALFSHPIADLSPLSELSSLVSLNLSHGTFTSVEPLKGLINLQNLWIEYSNVSNITDLSNLAQLKTLRLIGTGLVDVSGIENFTNLTLLSLANNSIADISALFELTALSFLYLNNNMISDISALTTMPELSDVNLESNRINDLSPLVENSGIGNGDTVSLYSNELFCVDSNLESLVNRGVTVHYQSSECIANAPEGCVEEITFGDPEVEAAVRAQAGTMVPLTYFDVYHINSLTVVSGSESISIELQGLECLTGLESLSVSNKAIFDLSPLSNLTNLQDVRLTNCNIEYLWGLENLPNLQYLDLSGNNIKELDPLGENTGIGAGDVVYLDGNPIICNDPNLVKLESREASVSYQCIPEGCDADPMFPDSDLEWEIRWMIDKQEGIITYEDVKDISTFSVGEMSPSSLVGMQCLTNLRYFSLYYGAISDLSPLGNLTQLENLQLSYTTVSDLTPISTLTNLRTLDLNHNALMNIEPLATLIYLEEIDLSFNSIGDISPLITLPNITQLNLQNNAIINLDTLNSFTGLGQDDQLDIIGNPYTCESNIMDLINALRDKGIIVYHHCEA